MWISRTSAARRKHVKGLLRVGGYFAVLSVVFGAIQVRAARAEVKNRTIELGRQMVQLANATNHDVNKLQINGQAMWLGSSVAKDSPRAVLDRYEAYCQDNAAQPSSEWRDLAGKADAAVDKKFISTGTMRSGSDDEGTVVCFTKGEASKPTVKEAIRSFAETGELGAFGSLRYVYVKKSDKGATIVLTAWTDDKFSLSGLIPEDGKDSGGSELPELPRPPNTSRVLATQIEGTPFGVNVYQGKDAPSKVVAFYDEEMHKRGWFALDPELDHKGTDGTPAIGRLYERNGVVLTLASNVEDDATFTALGLAGVGATGDGQNANSP